jgi:hypothetical protein
MFLCDGLTSPQAFFGPLKEHLAKVFHLQQFTRLSPGIFIRLQLQNMCVITN